LSQLAKGLPPKSNNAISARKRRPPGPSENISSLVQSLSFNLIHYISENLCTNRPVRIRFIELRFPSFVSPGAIANPDKPPTFMFSRESLKVAWNYQAGRTEVAVIGQDAFSSQE
jgi:hypothetical protein